MIDNKVRRTIQEYVASKKGAPTLVSMLLESFSLKPSDIDHLVRTTLDENGDPLIYYSDDRKYLIDSGKLKGWLRKSVT